MSYHKIYIKCNQCKAEYILPIKEHYYNQTIKVRCQKSTCLHPIHQNIPDEIVWGEHNLLYAIPPHKPKLKYYNVNGNIDEYTYHFEPLYIGKENVNRKNSFLKVGGGKVDDNHVLIVTTWNMARQSGKYKVKDLNSEHGTQLNGKLMEPDVYYPLKNRDMLKLGDSLLVFLNPKI